MGTTIEDGLIVWGMLAEKFETRTSLMHSLAEQLRETGEQFDDPDEIATADIRTISKALAELTDDDEAA